jgi:hypothetical protein
LSEAAAGAGPGADDNLAPLCHPAAVRLRCRAILDAVDDGRSANVRIDRARLPEVAERVAALTRRRFPDLAIPLHSRWRHFEAGGVDRQAELEALLAGRSAAEALRSRIDLTVVSVLLDAGAGGAWRYLENGREYRRSEGLGVASLRAFMQGRFSARQGDPLRADAEALATLDAAALRAVFQAGADNPMVGLEGRAALLARLGRTLVQRSAPHEARPGQLADRLGPGPVSAAQVLAEVLRLTGPAWASGSVVMGQPAGDMWPHRWAGHALPGGRIDHFTPGVVPFHKLSQWLSYSLLEPLQWAGVQVDGVDELTGLPEYRNGGLLLDAGVIVPRDKHAFERRWKPGDEFIVEWRALTVALLDELAPLVRERLGAPTLPLARILEGGTWAAGREIAGEKREGGVPPLQIDSDGTVF